MSLLAKAHVKKEVLLRMELEKMAILPPSRSRKKGVQAQSALSEEGGDLLEALSNNLTAIEHKQHLSGIDLKPLPVKRISRLAHLPIF
ncbi:MULTISPECIES: hypothetical protein [Moorena]|uniref:Uncharacterized protein n=1 Tax=Moorena producens 3L TaxID=489825 RepID=F4Y3K5_9CYAN|nr:MULTISPECIES: hypothetical protein [Moorena]NET66047.1 hypothetical protein [Moorena sp. SIO1G6]EGJ28681.1 hypothetical protein LYNGBM3L_72620 [Moorena producens 3L]NEP31572.1 hypothetical protein [Moorena sp. SIO3B2]NEP68877.1 hypothetical protein [Moorena sp. SIO3A5]OLT63878.1 hypothetical protein BI334_01525 [Moorena producens 3L]